MVLMNVSWARWVVRGWMKEWKKIDKCTRSSSLTTRYGPLAAVGNHAEKK